MFTSEDQIAATIIAEGLEAQDAQRIAKQARPCVWLETNSVGDEAQIPLGATKIGGRPDLPAGQDWPVRPPYPAGEHAARYRRELADPNAWSWATPEQREEFKRDYEQMIEVIGKPFPFSFIAQINLAHAWGAGPLDPDFPRSGLLSIFYDTLEEPWGYDPANHIGSIALFHATDAAPLARREPPAELAAVKRYVPFAPLICHAHACLTPIPKDTAQFRSLNLRKEAAGAYSEWGARTPTCTAAKAVPIGNVIALAAGRRRSRTACKRNVRSSRRVSLTTPTAPRPRQCARPPANGFCSRKSAPMKERR